MTPNSIGFICHTYVTTGYDMVTVECIDSKKSEGQTNIQTNKQINKQTNQRRQKDYSRHATIIINRQNCSDDIFNFPIYSHFIYESNTRHNLSTI